MNFEINSIITLNSKKEYFVANTIIYNNQFYSLLINTKEDNDYFVARQKGDFKLVKIDEKELYEVRKLIIEGL